MPTHTHRDVLVALRDWFAARAEGSEQAAAAALRDRLDLLPAPFTAASRPGHTLAESAILNALDAYLQEAPSQFSTAADSLTDTAMSSAIRRDLCRVLRRSVPRRAPKYPKLQSEAAICMYV